MKNQGNGKGAVAKKTPGVAQKANRNAAAPGGRSARHRRGEAPQLGQGETSYTSANAGRNNASTALEAVRSAVRDLYEAGAIGVMTMRHFDKVCLSEILDPGRRRARHPPP